MPHNNKLLDFKEFLNSKPVMIRRFDFAFLDLFLEFGLGFLEFSHSFTNAARQFRDLFCSKKEQYDQENHHHLLDSRSPEC